MRVWMMTVLAGCGLVWSVACQRTDEPPPRFNTALEAGEMSLVPMPVPNRSWDKSILGAAATPDELKTQASGGRRQAGQSITVDDSTPEGIAQAFADIMSAGQLQQLPDIVVPEQQEIAREMATAMVPAMEALRELQAAWNEQFPGQPFNMSGPSALPMSGTQVSVVSVEPVSDDEAEATIQPEGTPQAKKIQLKKIDGTWRVHDPDAPQPGQMEMVRKLMGAMPQLADALRGVTGRIRAGEFADAQAAEQALAQAGQQAMAEVMQGLAEAGEQPSREEPDAEPQVQPMDQPRGRSNDRGDEFDGVYTGPNQLRNR